MCNYHYYTISTMLLHLYNSLRTIICYYGVLSIAIVVVFLCASPFHLLVNCRYIHMCIYVATKHLAVPELCHYVFSHYTCSSEIYTCSGDFRFTLYSIFLHLLRTPCQSELTK